MKELGLLIYNEIEKIFRKKRFAVVLLILMILVPLFIYGQYRQQEENLKKVGTKDWKIVLQQQISDTQNRLNSSNTPEEFKKIRRLQMDQNKYYLEHDINPSVIGAPTFLRSFLTLGIGMFIPLLVLVVVIDMISGERSDGTIKMLLTRPVKRWKVLLSKFFAMILSVTTIMIMVIITAYTLSGIVFGFEGIDAPILTGFSIVNSQLITTGIHSIPQWEFLLMCIGLTWFVAIIVGTLAFMVSILVRNTPAGMGAMFASLIAGGILQGLASNWEGAKYVYSVNMDLISYLSGGTPTLEGLSMNFSIMTLSVWGIISLIISFIVFTREDMMG